MMNIVDSAGGREGRRFMREGEKVHCVACDECLVTMVRIIHRFQVNKMRK